MKVGNYVRTKEGYICKILKLNEPKYDDGYLDFNDINSPRIYKPNIIKSSPNIIDLIEVGDYVNGRLVHDNLIYLTEFGWVDFDTLEQTDTRQIKSVVTHEQFEKMMYKIGD